MSPYPQFMYNYIEKYNTEQSKKTYIYIMPTKEAEKTTKKKY